MATPPSRFSTPSASSHAARAAQKAPRSASYAPPSSTPSAHARNARTAAASDDFLSPVSKYNRSLDTAREEQAARMQTIESERAHRLATKPTTARLSTGALAHSSAKRKLTELELAAQALQTNAAAAARPTSRQSEPAKKIRTSSPPNKTTTQQQAVASRRGVSYGGTTHSSVSSSVSSSVRSSLSASALRRHEERHVTREYDDERVSAANAPDVQERYLAYEQQAQHHVDHATPPRSHRTSAAEAHSLFSRHNDPSVVTTPPASDSASSSPFKFPGYESSGSSAHGSPMLDVRTPPRSDSRRSSIERAPRGEDGMVDLDHVSTVSQLETLEGDDILSMMMAQSTPRVDRHFPSEQARTDSEEREIQFLRRRRLAASTARRSIDPNAPVVTNNVVRAKWSFDDVLEPIASPSTGAVRRGVVSIEAQQARDDAENAKAEAAENNTMVDDDDDDIETTEFKVEQFSRAQHWSVRRFLSWVLVGAGVICALDVAFPIFLSLFEPPLPYCDNNASMLGEGLREATALSIVGEKSDFTALQQYRADCRACPLFGVCSEGALVTCLPPLEQQNGACVESKEVQHALEQISMSIQKFVTDKAMKQVCGTPPLPSLSESRESQWGLDELSSAHVVVLLSELKEIVLNSPFAETMMNISLAATSGSAAAGYVFNRSLHLALSSFEKVTQISFHKLSQYVGSTQSAERGDMLIQFSTSVAPWSCRARNQLLTHAHFIAIAVVVLALAILLYRRWLVYKTKRALVDRLVKEVRFFLVGRAHRSERIYPANHLRDNLFDTLPGVSVRDRKWLRESVWPAVAKIVDEDSRVESRIAPIHGKHMVVWEWISSNSPVKENPERRTRLRSRRSRHSL